MSKRLKATAKHYGADAGDLVDRYRDDLGLPIPINWPHRIGGAFGFQFRPRFQNANGR